MSIYGIGTDIIEVTRIAAMIQRHGELFLERVYTADEIQYCAARAAANQHFAGRWAAKEAGLKAMGTGWARGIQWTDLEVRVAPGGSPSINLRGAAARICRELGIKEILISISHTRSFATAFAVAVNA